MAFTMILLTLTKITFNFLPVIIGLATYCYFERRQD